MQYLEQVPDSAKVATAVAAPVLTMFGVTLEEWTFILSAIVSLLFIIEKAPMAVKNIKTFIRWMRNGQK